MTAGERTGLKSINHLGNAGARYLLPEYYYKGLRFSRIRLLQICGDLYHPQHSYIPGAINNRGGLRRADIRVEIHAKIPTGETANGDSVSVYIYYLRIINFGNWRIKGQIQFFYRILDTPQNREKKISNHIKNLTKILILLFYYHSSAQIFFLLFSKQMFLFYIKMIFIFKDSTLTRRL